MSDAKAKKQIQDRLMTLIGKVQELEGICQDHQISLYPEVHLDGLQQQLLAAYSKLTMERPGL